MSPDYRPQSERQLLAEAICKLIAGFSYETVILALTDVLGMTLPAAATNLRNADALIDEVAVNTKRYARDNWAYVKEQVRNG